MATMERAEAGNRAQIGSVKAAVGMYGQRFLCKKPQENKTQMALLEQPLKARELHVAKRDIGRLHDNQTCSETVKAQAEMELTVARNTVKDLTLRIEETNAKTIARRKELQGFKKPNKHENEWALSPSETSNHQYMEVMRELEAVKQVVRRLKMDIASVLDTKKQAEKQTELSLSRLRSYSSSVEAIKKEIEATNEEEVLVELARMEAVRELTAIQSQREAKSEQFLVKMKKTRNRIDGLIQEINLSKELEAKLEITASDVEVLQNELKLVKATYRNSEKSSWDSLNRLSSSIDGISKKNEEALLDSATAELNEAKRELASIRDEGFRFMSSMDIIRNELKHVSDEMARLKKSEEKADTTVENLNSKLLKAKSKLDSVNVAEEKTRSIVTNLSESLQQILTETEAAKRERELITEETANIKLEIQKTESNIESEEEKLHAAMQELEAVKASEAKALESLRALTEKTVRDRALWSQHNSSITISNFEYEYLSRCAEGAEEIADKKVAAAQAWIEALKAGEKEILMKTEAAHLEIGELKLAEEREMHQMERALTAKKAVENKLHKKIKHEKQTEVENLQQIEIVFPRKSTKDISVPATPRRDKMRRSASPGAQYIARSGSIALRKKRKVIPSLTKFFRSKRNGKQP